jgi:hypothetical protein
VNFSACNLTHEGANMLANLIKVQALKRHTEAWKDSLRYGRPDLDSMFGIRRITINSNPMLGDKGVEYLAEAFKSDLWLKALDLQYCGITNKGANYLLDGLKFNAMMHVLDVRVNSGIDRDIVQKIMEQVMINSNCNSTEYEWMKAIEINPASSSTLAAPSTALNHQNHHSPKTSSRIGANGRDPTLSGGKSNSASKKRRNTNASFNKKPQFNTSINSLKMKRCKSTGSVICNKSPAASGSNSRASQAAGQYHPHTSKNSNGSSNGGGVPWRAAARARNHMNCAYRKLNALSSTTAADYDEYDEDMMNGDVDLSEEFENEDHELQHIIKNLDINDKEAVQNQQNLMASSTFVDSAAASANAGAQASSSFSLQNRKSQINQRTKHHHHHHQQQQNLSTTNTEFLKNLDKIKNANAKDLLHILQKEQEAKTQLEDMLLSLQDENIRLKAQISFLKSKCEQQQSQINMIQKNSKALNQSNLNRTTSSYLDDDRALEIIELTLLKYQNFLEFLRNEGFGKLIEFSEMNQENVNNNQNIDAKGKNKSKSFAQRSNSIQHQNNQKSPSKLTDEQRYYLEKINKTKAKLMQAQNSHFNNSTLRNDTVKEEDEYEDEFYNNFLGAAKSFSSKNLLKNITNTNASALDFTNSFMTINHDEETNMNIDTLLSNALETTRSYRRMNSSTMSANSTVLQNSTQYHQAAYTKRENRALSEIEENTKENSSLSLNNSTINNKKTNLNNDTTLPNIEELQKTTETLLEQYKNIKSKSLNTNNQNDESVTQNNGTKKKQAIKSVSLSPQELKNSQNNVFLFVENLEHDVEKSVISESSHNNTVSNKDQNSNNNKSTAQSDTNSPTTVINNKREQVNQQQQPPAVSARSISTLSNATLKKKSSMSENLNNNSDNFELDDTATEKSEEKRVYSNRSGGRKSNEDDNIEENIEEDDGEDEDF